MPKFNLDDAVAKISAPWTPVDVATVNGSALRIALFEGEYHEHTHEYDELFLVYLGAITIWTESGTIKLAEAEGYFREAHEGLLRVVGSDRPQTLNAMARLGRVLQMQGRLDEAQPYLREALAVAERLRTRIVAEERGRAAYAEKLNLSSIAAMLASVLIQMDRPEDAFTVAERGRSRALLDLLARADRDVLEQARRRAEQTGPAAVMAVEEALAAEQEATVDLATAEALVASPRAQAPNRGPSKAATGAPRTAQGRRLRGTGGQGSGSRGRPGPKAKHGGAAVTAA